MTLHSLRTRTVLVIPIRLLLGLVAVGGAVAAGAAARSALLAFFLGVFGIAFVIFNDPRSRLAHGELEPLPFPAGARLASRWRQAYAAMLPSTVGVFVLAVAALLVEPTLGALLGGVCAGLGVAAALSLGRVDPALYVDPRNRVVYRR